MIHINVNPFFFKSVNKLKKQFANLINRILLTIERRKHQMLKLSNWTIYKTVF